MEGMEGEVISFFLQLRVDGEKFFPQELFMKKVIEKKIIFHSNPQYLVQSSEMKIFS